MKINKKNDLKFRTECTLLVLCENAVAINTEYKNGNYRINGVKNSVEFTLNENVGSGLFSVFCRFDNCNELSGSMNSKHNFHTQSSVDNAIKEFDLHLREIVKILN